MFVWYKLSGLFPAVLMLFITITTDCARPEKKDVIVGLISKCMQRPIGQRIAMGLVMSKKIGILARTGFIGRYKEFDVCEDERDLVETLNKLLLEPEWILKDERLRIKGIIAFIPENLLKLAVSILSYTDIKVFPMFKLSDDYRRWSDNFIHFEPIVAMIPEDIVVDIIKKFDWKHVAIVQIKRNSIEDKDKLKMDRIRRELPNLCFDYQNLNTTSVAIDDGIKRRLFETLKRDQSVKAVIIKGDLAAKFMLDADKYGVKKYWILLSQYREPEIAQNHPEFIGIVRSIKNYRYQKIEYHNDTVCSQPTKIMEVFRHQAKSCSSTEVSSQNSRYLVDEIKYAWSILIPNRLVVVRTILEDGFYNYMDVVQFYNNKVHSKQRVKNLKITQKAIQLGTGQCRECKECKNQCLKTGPRVVEPVNYTKSFALGCLKCRQGLIFDPEYGTCTECPIHTMANKNQTKCYDPYIKEDVFLACYIVNGLGLLLCLFTAFVYYRHRNTPVVRSSDFTLTIIQLLLCAAIFVALPIVTLAPLSWFVCTVRPCVFGILLVAIVSIVVCKAEKILIIFYTRRRLTPKDIKDLYIRQLCIFLFLLIIDMIILPTTFRLPSSVKTRKFPTTSDDTYLIRYCSTDDRFDVQIVYCIVLLLLAIAQGYRGRKLPSNYNEGNSIIVSASSTICAFIFKIWITNTPRHRFERTSTVWLSLSVSVLLLIFTSLRTKGIHYFTFTA
ncbi:uncharacterized protein [Clytia hemisphaerica]|uniref:G-protein coupled receptors family 3 profile domain-containing protein n=1 Tax=Clytia hemisphaerica TaxID=252671 RepID=A0A7M5XIJ8_9CNID